MSEMSAVRRDVHGRVRRPVSVLGLIEWAFQKEFATLDFDDLGDGWSRPSVGTEYLLMKRQIIGCQIDGGGRSDPHPDADVVASALAALPDAFGGRRVALWVADLARAGTVPSWGQGLSPLCTAAEWRVTKHGRFAKTRRIGVHRYESRGRAREVEIRVCPVVYMHTAPEIARARRTYLQWWQALNEIRQNLVIYDNLTAWDVTQEMPAMRPWQKGD